MSRGRRCGAWSMPLPPAGTCRPARHAPDHRRDRPRMPDIGGHGQGASEERLRQARGLHPRADRRAGPPARPALTGHPRPIPALSRVIRGVSRDIQPARHPFAVPVSAPSRPAAAGPSRAAGFLPATRTAHPIWVWPAHPPPGLTDAMRSRRTTAPGQCAAAPPGPAGATPYQGNRTASRRCRIGKGALHGSQYPYGSRGRELREPG
jgi:hypothetical protein